MSKEIIQVSVDVLKVHPRNTEFFDDIQGEEYDRFKQSIKQDGILSPILVSPDMTVISGHQRLKACKELGINLVPIMIRDDLTDENEKLKLLLAANFGRSKNDDAKQRKIATEYVALCGFKHGELGNGRKKTSDNQNSTLTQEEIARQLGISVPTLNSMLAIERKLTPDIKEMLDNGVFTKTTASKILTKLTKDEQQELIKTLPSDIRVTQSQMNEYIQQLKEKDNQIAGYEIKLKRISELTVQIENLKKELNERPQVEVEVKPKDYDMIVKLKNESEKDNQRLRENYESKCKELNELKAQVRLEKEKSIQKKAENKIIDDAIFFCGKINSFIKDVGGLAYLGNKLEQLPENEKKSYVKSVSIVKAWADNILENIN